MDYIATLTTVVEDASSFVLDGKTTFSFYVKPTDVKNADTVLLGRRYLLIVSSNSVSYPEIGMLSLIRPGHAVAWKLEGVLVDDGLLRFGVLHELRNTARALC